MNTLQFLKTILPEHGTHYLVLFEEGVPYPTHQAYSDLESMAEAIRNTTSAARLSVFHACACYKQPAIYFVDGEKTKQKYRVSENWQYAKSFWVDIDCGPKKFEAGDGYLKKIDAVAAIDSFCIEVGWPKPLIVDSGNGVHGYWPMTETISSETWISVARTLKRALNHFGVRADPSRTADFASILRPPGAMNRKSDPAKCVSLKRAGKPTDPTELANALQKYVDRFDLEWADKSGTLKGSSKPKDSTSLELKSFEGKESYETVQSALLDLNPGMSRENWRTVIWGIRHGIGDTQEAFELADRWSMGKLNARFYAPANYSNREAVEQVWNSYESNRSDRITVGSLYKMASDAGWKIFRDKTDTISSRSEELVHEFRSNSSSKEIFELKDGDVRFLTEPPAGRTYVFANTVTAGSYNVLAGSGGTLKTMLMLSIAAHIAVGRDFGEIQTLQGAAMLFLGEEDCLEVSRRLSGACKYYDLDPLVVKDLVKAFPASGIDIRLTRATHGTLDSTALVQNIIDLARQQTDLCGHPVRLIVIDHARLAMDGDPDDAAHVTQLTRALTRIAQTTGAAVMLLAHSPKTVLKQSAKEMSIADVAGSSAFSDNARSGFIMYGMREDDAKILKILGEDRKRYVKLECAKANYGPQGSGWWFEKVTLEEWQIQVLKPTSLFKPMLTKGQVKVQLGNRICEYLANQPGRSRRQLRGECGTARRLAASEKDVGAALNSLLEEGRVELRKPTPLESTKYKLPKGRVLLFVDQQQP